MVALSIGYSVMKMQELSAEFVLNVDVSADRTNGFSVNYRGAECLESVRVTLRYRDGTEERTDFNMCEALGW